MLNQVTLLCKSVSEPTLRRTKTNDTLVSDFRVVHSTSKTVNPLYIDVEVWGIEAERVHSSVKKGDIIIVTGELRQDVWTPKNPVDGKTQRSKIKITASRVIFTNKGKRFAFDSSLAEGYVHDDQFSDEETFDDKEI